MGGVRQEVDGEADEDSQILAGESIRSGSSERRRNPREAAQAGAHAGWGGGWRGSIPTVPAVEPIGAAEGQCTSAAKGVVAAQWTGSAGQSAALARVDAVAAASSCWASGGAPRGLPAARAIVAPRHRVHRGTPQGMCVRRGSVLQGAVMQP